MWFSSTRRCFGLYFFKVICLFFGEVFAEDSQIPCFSSLIFVDFCGQLRSFCLESCKSRGFCMVDVSTVKQQEAANRQRLRSNATKETEDTSRIRMDVIPPHPPNRAERQMQVQAGMCRKSRVGKNTVKTDAKCDTRRKTPKKTMRNAELNMLCTV